MPANPALRDHLLTRRSVGQAFLAEPAPTGADLQTLLTIATRVPDHGKLAPGVWSSSPAMPVPQPARNSLKSPSASARRLMKPASKSSAASSSPHRWSSASSQPPSRM